MPSAAQASSASIVPLPSAAVAVHERAYVSALQARSIPHMNRTNEGASDGRT
jgi:hypothetical protein